MKWNEKKGRGNGIFIQQAKVIIKKHISPPLFGTTVAGTKLDP